jgi:hypothetical protein
MSIFEKWFSKDPEIVTEQKESPNEGETNESFNVQAFNQKFVEANKALTAGNTEGLKSGIGLLIESLSVSGPFGSERGIET